MFTHAHTHNRFVSQIARHRPRTDRAKCSEYSDSARARPRPPLLVLFSLKIEERNPSSLILWLKYSHSFYYSDQKSYTIVRYPWSRFFRTGFYSSSVFSVVKIRASVSSPAALFSTAARTASVRRVSRAQRQTVTPSCRGKTQRHDCGVEAAESHRRRLSDPLATSA